MMRTRVYTLHRGSSVWVLFDSFINGEAINVKK